MNILDAKKKYQEVLIGLGEMIDEKESLNHKNTCKECNRLLVYIKKALKNAEDIKYFILDIENRNHKN